MGFQTVTVAAARFVIVATLAALVFAFLTWPLWTWGFWAEVSYLAWLCLIVLSLGRIEVDLGDRLNGR